MIVETGREISTPSGDCEVWVEAGFPRSSYAAISIASEHRRQVSRTCVRSVVLPAPQGPRSKKVGNVVTLPGRTWWM